MKQSLEIIAYYQLQTYYDNNKLLKYRGNIVSINPDPYGDIYITPRKLLQALDGYPIRVIHKEGVMEIFAYQKIAENDERLFEIEHQEFIEKANNLTEGCLIL